MKIIRLAPCPFCGSPARGVKHIGFFVKRFWIECSYERCPVMLMTGKFERAEDCIKAWNTRVQEAA